MTKMSNLPLVSAIFALNSSINSSQPPLGKLFFITSIYVLIYIGSKRSIMDTYLQPTSSSHIPSFRPSHPHYPVPQTNLQHGYHIFRSFGLVCMFQNTT